MWPFIVDYIIVIMIKYWYKGEIIMDIRPVSDLRNKFTEIEKTVKKGQPVYLTKNGYGVMVVLSIDTYSKLTNGGTDLNVTISFFTGCSNSNS